MGELWCYSDCIVFEFLNCYGKVFYGYIVLLFKLISVMIVYNIMYFVWCKMVGYVLFSGFSRVL